MVSIVAADILTPENATESTLSDSIDISDRPDILNRRATASDTEPKSSTACGQDADATTSREGGSPLPNAPKTQGCLGKGPPPMPENAGKGENVPALPEKGGKAPAPPGKGGKGPAPPGKGPAPPGKGGKGPALPGKGGKGRKGQTSNAFVNVQVTRTRAPAPEFVRYETDPFLVKLCTAPGCMNILRNADARMDLTEERIPKTLFDVEAEQSPQVPELLGLRYFNKTPVEAKKASVRREEGFSLLDSPILQRLEMILHSVKKKAQLDPKQDAEAVSMIVDALMNCDAGMLRPIDINSLHLVMKNTEEQGPPIRAHFGKHGMPTGTSVLKSPFCHYLRYELERIPHLVHRLMVMTLDAEFADMARDAWNRLDTMKKGMAVLNARKADIHCFLQVLKGICNTLNEGISNKVMTRGFSLKGLASVETAKSTRMCDYSVLHFALMLTPRFEFSDCELKALRDAKDMKAFAVHDTCRATISSVEDMQRLSLEVKAKSTDDAPDLFLQSLDAFVGKVTPEVNNIAVAATELFMRYKEWAILLDDVDYLYPPTVDDDSKGDLFDLMNNFALRVNKCRKRLNLGKMTANDLYEFCKSDSKEKSAGGLLDSDSKENVNAPGGEQIARVNTLECDAKRKDTDVSQSTMADELDGENQLQSEKPDELGGQVQKSGQADELDGKNQLQSEKPDELGQVQRRNADEFDRKNQLQSEKPDELGQVQRRNAEEFDRKNQLQSEKTDDLGRQVQRGKVGERDETNQLQSEKPDELGQVQRGKVGELDGENELETDCSQLSDSCRPLVIPGETARKCEMEPSDEIGKGATQSLSSEWSRRPRGGAMTRGETVPSEPMPSEPGNTRPSREPDSCANPNPTLPRAAPHPCDWSAFEANTVSASSRMSVKLLHKDSRSSFTMDVTSVSTREGTCSPPNGGHMPRPTHDTPGIALRRQSIGSHCSMAESVSSVAREKQLSGAYAQLEAETPGYLRKASEREVRREVIVSSANRLQTPRNNRPTLAYSAPARHDGRTPLASAEEICAALMSLPNKKSKKRKDKKERDPKGSNGMDQICKSPDVQAGIRMLFPGVAPLCLDENSLVDTEISEKSHTTPVEAIKTVENADEKPPARRWPTVKLRRRERPARPTPRKKTNPNPDVNLATSIPTVFVPSAHARIPDARYEESDTFPRPNSNDPDRARSFIHDSWRKMLESPPSRMYPYPVVSDAEWSASETEAEETDTRKMPLSMAVVL